MTKVDFIFFEGGNLRYSLSIRERKWVDLKLSAAKILSAPKKMKRNQHHISTLMPAAQIEAHQPHRHLF